MKARGRIWMMCTKCQKVGDVKSTKGQKTSLCACVLQSWPIYNVPLVSESSCANISHFLPARLPAPPLFSPV